MKKQNYCSLTLLILVSIFMFIVVYGCFESRNIDCETITPTVTPIPTLTNTPTPTPTVTPTPVPTSTPTPSPTSTPTPEPTPTSTPTPTPVIKEELEVYEKKEPTLYDTYSEKELELFQKRNIKHLVNTLHVVELQPLNIILLNLLDILLILGTKNNLLDS